MKRKEPNKIKRIMERIEADKRTSVKPNQISPWITAPPYFATGDNCEGQYQDQRVVRVWLLWCLRALSFLWNFPILTLQTVSMQENACQQYFLNHKKGLHVASCKYASWILPYVAVCKETMSTLWHVCVWFVGTQFSNLYTAVDTPAARCFETV